MDVDPPIEALRRDLIKQALVPDLEIIRSRGSENPPKWAREIQSTFDDMMSSVPPNTDLYFVSSQVGTTLACIPRFVHREKLYEVVADTAHQVILEVSKGQAWPQCPKHHRHPLWIKQVHSGLVWTCISDPSVTIPVGQLPRSTDQDRS